MPCSPPITCRQLLLDSTAQHDMAQHEIRQARGAQETSNHNDLQSNK